MTNQEIRANARDLYDSASRRTGFQGADWLATATTQTPMPLPTGVADYRQPLTDFEVSAGVQPLSEPYSFGGTGNGKSHQDLTEAIADAVEREHQAETGGQGWTPLDALADVFGPPAPEPTTQAEDDEIVHLWTMGAEPSACGVDINHTPYTFGTDVPGEVTCPACRATTPATVSPRQQAAQWMTDAVEAMAHQQRGKCDQIERTGPTSVRVDNASYDGVSHAISYSDITGSGTVIMTLSTNTSAAQAVELIWSVAGQGEHS